MSSIVFPNGGRSVIEQMCQRFPELHVNDDAKQRQLTTRIQEQFVYQWGPRWGGKKRTGLSDDYKSKDSMAYDEGAAVSTWDMFQGNEAVSILVGDGQPPHHPDQPLSDATFMAVQGRDWLGVPEAPGGGPGPAPEGDDEVVDLLHQIQAQMAENQGALIGLGNFNTERILQRIDDVKSQMEESLKKILAIYLAMNRPDQPEGPALPPGSEGIGDIQKLVLKYLIQNRPER